MFFKLEVSILFIILIVTAHGIDSHKEATLTEMRAEEVNNDGDSDSDVFNYDVFNSSRVAQDSFYDAREDLFELRNVEKVALLKFVANSKVHPDGISSRERRASDCPLRNQTARSEEKQMRVHVLPSRVPFSVRIKLDLIALLLDEKYFTVRSSNLNIKEAEWSELSIKADIKDGKWGVTVTKNGVARFFQTDFSSTYIFDFLEVDIPSKTVKWYVGPKNDNCDALAPTTASDAPPTITTTKTDVTVKSATDGVRASSELVENKGIMNE